MPAPPNPANELEALRKKLVAARLALPDRLERAVAAAELLRAWLVGRRETVDRRLLADQGRVRPAARALPLERRRRRRRAAAHRPAGRRPRDELAALSRLVSRLRDGARRLRHPQAEGHRRVPPQLLVVPCLGFGPGGVRLGYGGGFFDRTCARCSRGR